MSSTATPRSARDDLPDGAPDGASAVAPTDDVPTPIRDWLRARPGRPVVVAAAAILLLQLAVRGWLGLRGYYYLDDFAFTGNAATQHLFSYHYLMLSYNNHLMPGSFVWVWLLTTLAPMNFSVVVLVDLALQALLGVAFFRLLRSLFGLRPAILVPFVVGTLSAVSLPAFLWWAAALNQLPQQLAMVAALLYHLRYLRTGRVRAGVAGVAAVLAGLLFSEKSLFIVPLVFAFTVLYDGRGGPWQRLGGSLRRHARVWAAYLVVVVPYVVYYLLTVPSPTRSGASGGALGQLTTQSFFHALIPGLLGGPWHWVAIGAAGALAGPGDFARTLALVLFAAIVCGTVAVRSRAAFGWSLAFGYAVMNLAVLAVSRATFVGPVIGDEYRYITELAIVFALGGALSVLPLAGRWRHGVPEQIRLRPWVRRALQGERGAELRGLLPRRTEAAVTAVLVVSFAASATVTSVAYDRFWRVNPARPYLTTLRAQLEQLPAGQEIADNRVPAGVAWALLGEWSYPSHILLSALPDEGRQFLASGQTAEDLRVIDDSGRVQRGAIDGVHAAPGPAGACGWRLGDRPVTIRMAPASWPGYWTVRIGYIASSATSATVTAGNTTTTVPFRRGLGSVWFLVTGTVASVDVSPLSTDATVCTNDVSVGTPVPVEAAP